MIAFFKNFQIFVNFHLLFYNWILFYLNTWWSENNLYDFYFLNVFNGSKCSLCESPMWVWEECVMLLLRTVIYKFQLNNFVLLVIYMLTYFQPAWPIHYYKRGVDVSNYNNIFVYFSFHFYQLLPETASCFVVGYKHM